jgi:hypothetical protein
MADLILTDIEMSHHIWGHLKGDNTHKENVMEDWYQFTADNYDELMPITKFIERTNHWLRTHHIPTTVVGFNLFDTDINGTTWVVEQAVKSNEEDDK